MIAAPRRGGKPGGRGLGIAVLHRDHTSGPGAWVRVTWVHMDPAQVDRLVDL